MVLVSSDFVWVLLHEFVFSSLADLYLKKKFHHWQCLQTCLRIVCLACRAGLMGCLGKYEVSLALILQDQLLDSDIPQCPLFFFLFFFLLIFQSYPRWWVSFFTLTLQEEEVPFEVELVGQCPSYLWNMRIIRIVVCFHYYASRRNRRIS